MAGIILRKKPIIIMFLKGQNKIFSAVFVRMEEVLFCTEPLAILQLRIFPGGFAFEKEASL